MEAKSFDQIFVVLNQYWTFVQYELLEYVVHEYGNAWLKKAYIADMDELESQVNLDHFMAKRRCSPRPDSVALNIHLSGSQHRLRDARHVQWSIAEQTGLHPHAVRTLQSTPGSTILTLLVPYAVAGHVVASFRGMLPAGDLLSRPLEERVVYTMYEAETEMNLPLVCLVLCMCTTMVTSQTIIVIFSMQNLQVNVQVHAAAQLPMSAVNTGQPYSDSHCTIQGANCEILTIIILLCYAGWRGRRGSGDPSHSASTGYETLSRCITTIKTG